MATVPLGDDPVIIGRIPDSGRWRGISDSDDLTDRLQANNIKALLELKVFDLGLVSSHRARGCREMSFSPQTLIKRYTDECRTPGSGLGATGSPSRLSLQTRGLLSTAAGSRPAPSLKPRVSGRQSAGRHPHRLAPSISPLNEDRIRQEGPSYRSAQIPVGCLVTCCGGFAVGVTTQAC